MNTAFTALDVIGLEDNAFPRIYADRRELIQAPTEWQKMGLQETRTGYGRKLNSGLKIEYCGKLYRIYITIFSNNGSAWFTVKGKTIYVD